MGGCFLHALNPRKYLLLISTGIRGKCCPVTLFTYGERFRLRCFPPNRNVEVDPGNLQRVEQRVDMNRCYSAPRPVLGFLGHMDREGRIPYLAYPENEVFWLVHMQLLNLEADRKPGASRHRHWPLGMNL